MFRKYLCPSKFLCSGIKKNNAEHIDVVGIGLGVSMES
jgi:hypothetical protein